MDINFHYFTTKVVATAIGYKEEDAQLIAAYCQLVNDFNEEEIELDNTVSVPEFVKHLVYANAERKYFYGIATHHNSLTVAQLQLEKFQRQRLIPFHFPLLEGMPKKFITGENDPGRIAYRTAPISIENPSAYWKDISNINTAEGKQTMICRGILCHILGDSYGNQRFSGTNGWENCAYLWDVVDNVQRENITKTYSTLDVSVGHKYLGKAPDESYLSYTMKQRSDPAEKQKTSYQNHYSRNNPRDFMKAAKTIYDFLLAGKTGGVAAEFKTLEEKLLKCYVNSGKTFEDIKKVWAAEFPKEKFTYDAFSLSKLKTGNDEGFFHFNYIGDIVRKKADPYFVYPFS